MAEGSSVAAAGVALGAGVEDAVGVEVAAAVGVTVSAGRAPSAFADTADASAAESGAVVARAVAVGLAVSDAAEFDAEVAANRSAGDTVDCSSVGRTTGTAVIRGVGAEVGFGLTVTVGLALGI